MLCDTSCKNCSDGVSCNHCVDAKYKIGSNALCSNDCIAGCKVCLDGSSCVECNSDRYSY